MSKAIRVSLNLILFSLVCLVSGESGVNTSNLVREQDAVASAVVASVVGGDLAKFHEHCSLKLKLSISVELFEKMRAAFSLGNDAKVQCLGTILVNDETVYLYKYPSSQKGTDLLLRFCFEGSKCTGLYIQ